MQIDKKLLIITYYWPPAGGPGVQRWLKFVKYLPDFGIQPIVYVPENATYPILDEGLVDQVSSKVIILKQKIWEPYKLASFLSKKNTKTISSGIIPMQRKQTFLQKLLLWVRGNLFIPDARVFWVKPSVTYLANYIEAHNIETIITSGPPHSLHLIGLALKQQFRLQWIADFRDPWTTIGYHKSLKLSAFAAKKHKNLEQKVLQNADAILVTSATTKLDFEKRTNQPITIITNGFDEENVGVIDLDKKFTMAHIGSFLSERNPLNLWDVLSELTKTNDDFAQDFELKLIGAISEEVLQSINDFNLSKFVNNLGYISHKEAILQQKSAQVLLLVEINSEDTKSIIPGKLFEYMAAQRPIIGIGPKDADFAAILHSSQTGQFFLYEDKDDLKSLILNHYHKFKIQDLTVNAKDLMQYSRRNLTKKLADLIQT